MRKDHADLSITLNYCGKARKRHAEHHLTRYGGGTRDVVAEVL